MDSTSFVIYPELEATEVRLLALKRYLCSFYFRIDNETGRIQWNTLYSSVGMSSLYKNLKDFGMSNIFN